MRTSTFSTLLLLLIIFTLAACPPLRRGSGGDDDDAANDDDSAGDDDDTGDDDDSTPGDDDDATGCAEILSVDPEADETDVFTSRVSVTWDAVPDSGNITVAQENGPQLAGSITDDDNGRTLIFNASAALPGNMTFEVTISQDCTDDATYEFTTGPFGASVSPESALLNRAFTIDLANASFVQPPGVGALFQGFLADEYLLMEPTTNSDLPNGEMHVLGGVGELDGGDVVQDICAETLPWTAGDDAVVGTGDDNPADWTNPVMELEADEVSFGFQGADMTVQDLEITAVFAPDGESFVGGTFAGVIDTRSLVGLLDSEDPNAMCDLVEETLGVTCTDCGGGENFCLAMVAEDVTGSWLSSLSGGLTPRTCDQIIDDSSCPNGDYTVDGDDNGQIAPLLCPSWTP